MEWHDQGIVIAERRHGESGAIVTLLTAEHGRHPGLVRGAHSARARGIFVPGNLVVASWRARLDEHLGNFTAELLEPFAARVLDDAGRLACLASACALSDLALPEREPHPRAFVALHDLIEQLPSPDWAEAYVRWEIALLAELGFGLDLQRCAVTGSTEALCWVSPKTGRAVSRAAGAPWAAKLLALPGFLLDPTVRPSPAELGAGLALTSHFLAGNVFHPDRREPAARIRLLERITRLATISGRGETE